MNKIRKFQYGGPGYFINPETNKSIRLSWLKTGNLLGEGGLSVLGAIGDAFKWITTAGANTDYGLTSWYAFPTSQERTNIAKGKENARLKSMQKIDEAAPYMSPANYITAWTQGSWNPIVGALKLLELGPLAQLGGAMFDIATFAKGKPAAKGTVRVVDEGLARAGNIDAKGRIIAREMNRNIKNPEILNNSLQTGLFVPNVTSTITGSPSLAFFERQPSKISSAERAGVPRGDRNFTPRWHVANYPGYLLKGLIRGSLLEKQLSKTGTININLLNAYFNKASQIEREIANKVLTEKFAGLKTIDYNQFKKAVLDELIGKYKRVPLTEWADYGMESLGYETLISHDGNAVAYNEITGDFELIAPFTPFKPNYTLNTFTFESPRIPYGNTKHYGGNPLGHSRTFTTTEDPHILYVMESLSDWAQKGLNKKTHMDAQSAYQRAFESAKERLQEINLMKSNLEKGLAPDGHKILYDWEIRDIEDIINITKKLLASSNARVAKFDAILHPEKYILLNHLIKNYLQRQLQENLRYAAENGYTKMRYPTSETAAKIEGYSRRPLKWFNLKGELVILTTDAYDPVTFEIKPLYKETFGNFTHSSPEYAPEHQTILKKYADFPKLFLKLFKDLKVGTVTDAKGNTWYEVDVPKGYLSREWQFKKGGVLKFQYGGLTHYTPKLTKIINDVYKYLIDKGCTPVQAFALMGNIMLESSWDPQIRLKDGDRAYGLFQMHGDLYKAYLKYLQDTKRQDDLYAPLDYVLDMINETKDNNGILVAPHPYTTDYNRVLGRTDKEALDYREETYGKRERSGTLYLLPELLEAWNNPNISIDDLTTAFTNVFERPGRPEYDSRIRYANEYNTMFNLSHTKEPLSTEVPIIPLLLNFKIRDKMINKVKELTYEPTFSEILDNVRKTISVGGSYGRWKLGGKLRKHQLGGLIQTGLNFYNNAKLSNEFDEATDAIIKAAKSKQQAKAYKYGLMLAEQLLSQLQSPDIHYSKDIDLPVLALQIANSVYDEDLINQIKLDRLKEKSSIFNNTINSGNYDISGGLGILGDLFGLINKKTTPTTSTTAPTTLSGLFETPTLKAPIYDYNTMKILHKI